MKKVCRSCGRAKEESAFLAGKAQRVSSTCSTCRRKSRAQHIKSYYRNLPPDKRHELSHKRRAREAGVGHETYSRSEILARWGHLCCYCDAPAEHLDHVQPISKGGDDKAANIVPACAPCNLSKGALTLAEWAARDFPPPF